MPTIIVAGGHGGSLLFSLIVLFLSISFFISFLTLDDNHVYKLSPFFNYSPPKLKYKTTNQQKTSLSSKLFNAFKQRLGTTSQTTSEKPNITIKQVEIEDLPPWNPLKESILFKQNIHDKYSESWYSFLSSQPDKIIVSTVYPRILHEKWNSTKNTTISIIEQFSITSDPFFINHPKNQFTTLEWNLLNRFEFERQIDFVIQSPDGNCLLIVFKQSSIIKTLCGENQIKEFHVTGTAPITAATISSNSLECIYYSQEDDFVAFRKQCLNDPKPEEGSLNAEDLFHYFAALHEFQFDDKIGVLGLKVVGYLQEFGSYDFAVGFKLFIKRNSTWYENHMTWIDHIHRITNRRGRLGNLGKQFTQQSKDGKLITITNPDSYLLIIDFHDGINLQVYDFSSDPEMNSEEILLDAITEQHRYPKSLSRSFANSNGTKIGIIKEAKQIILMERESANSKHWEAKMQIYEYLEDDLRKPIVDARFIDIPGVNQEVLVVLFKDGSISSYYTVQQRTSGFFDSVLNFIQTKWKLCLVVTLVIALYVWNEFRIRRRRVAQNAHAHAE